MTFGKVQRTENRSKSLVHHQSMKEEEEGGAYLHADKVSRFSTKTNVCLTNTKKKKLSMFLFLLLIYQKTII